MTHQDNTPYATEIHIECVFQSYPSIPSAGYISALRIRQDTSEFNGDDTVRKRGYIRILLRPETQSRAPLLASGSALRARGASLSSRTGVGYIQATPPAIETESRQNRYIR